MTHPQEQNSEWIERDIPADIITAAREAAATTWGGDDYTDLAREFRSGMRDDSGSVQTAIAALVAERQRDPWQPMKTLLPSHGMIVLGYGEYRERDGFTPAFMRWSDSLRGWSVNAMPFYPTHWQPLPAAPKGE